MEVKELRIGNTILKNNQPVSVDLGIMRKISNGSLVYYPILLTEKWLLKFGFKRLDDGSVSAQFSYGINPDTQDFLIYLIWQKDWEKDYALKNFPFLHNGHFRIKTVHQLQNLVYDLCGHELQILK